MESEAGIFTYPPLIFKERMMNILFNDVLQNSDAPKELISGSLADAYKHTINEDIEITLPQISSINSMGLGNFDGDFFAVFRRADWSIIGVVYNPVFDKNGLYLLDKEYPGVKRITLSVSMNVVFGRLAFGRAINLKTSIPKEPTLVSTNSPRVTLSGQVIDGLGGYNHWRVSLDTRYKIDNDKLNEIIKGFPSLSKGLPMFVSFEDEKDRLPFERLYANDTNQQELSFESSINKNLFSRRFIFEERF
jgi:hypothetical protein